MNTPLLEIPHPHPSHKFLGLMRYLLLAGADVRLKDDYGNSALDQARSGQDYYTEFPKKKQKLSLFYQTLLFAAGANYEKQLKPKFTLANLCRNQLRMHLLGKPSVVETNDNINAVASWFSIPRRVANLLKKKMGIKVMYHTCPQI